MTFDDVLLRLLGWIHCEVYIWIQDAPSLSRLAYVRGPLHPAVELNGEMGFESEAYAFAVGDAKETEIILDRESFEGAEGDYRYVEVRIGSALIHISTMN